MMMLMTTVAIMMMLMSTMMIMMMLMTTMTLMMMLMTTVAIMMMLMMTMTLMMMLMTTMAIMMMLMMTMIASASRIYDVLLSYLISRSQVFKGSDVIGREGFTEEVDRGHLTAEHGLGIHVVAAAQVTLVKGLASGILIVIIVDVITITFNFIIFIIPVSSPSATSSLTS